jgi:Fe-S-cluster containining protein
MCCDGTIFDDVKLGPEEDSDRLQALGLNLVRTRARSPAAFQQPCLAFDGCRCRIYAERPLHCRSFECLVLKSVRAGRRTVANALGIIRSTRQQVDKVCRLLRELGDTDEDAALKTRFRRTARRLQTAEQASHNASLFADLTIAMHELNLKLNEEFYR